MFSRTCVTDLITIRTTAETPDMFSQVSTKKRVDLLAVNAVTFDRCLSLEDWAHENDFEPSWIVMRTLSACVSLA
jgi:hypothetical protein